MKDRAMGSLETLSLRSEKASATVPVALFGVSPNRWGGRFRSPIGAPRRLLPTCRRDPDALGRDGPAPHPQLHLSVMGSGMSPETSCAPATCMVGPTSTAT